MKAVEDNPAQPLACAWPQVRIVVDPRDVPPGWRVLIFEHGPNLFRLGFRKVPSPITATGL
jgi:hypothetical protein